MKRFLIATAFFFQLSFFSAPAEASYTPRHYHWLSTISYYGDFLEMEDGSTWYVNPYDAYTALSWYSTDPLILSPNGLWCSNYYYNLTNEAQGTSILVNPHAGPLRFGPYTHWIASIDRIGRTVILEDGSVWSASYSDDEFLGWDINHTIIIGANNSWFSSYPSILINVDMDTYVRAQER